LTVDMRYEDEAHHSPSCGGSSLLEYRGATYNNDEKSFNFHKTQVVAKCNKQCCS
jgi:hypothetical protein